MSETFIAPALGISTVVNMGDRQITLQFHAPLDMAPADLNEIIDRVMAVADRQQAKAELPALHAELDKHVQTVAQFDEDSARVEHDFEVEQAKADVTIATLVEEKAKAINEAQEKHVASGRVSEFQMGPAVASRVKGFDRDIENVKAAKEKRQAERDLAVNNLGISRQRYDTAIEGLRAKIAECEAKL